MHRLGAGCKLRSSALDWCDALRGRHSLRSIGSRGRARDHVRSLRTRGSRWCRCGSSLRRSRGDERRRYVLFLSGSEPPLVRRAVQRVGTRLGLPDNWLNDAAKGYVHGLALGEVLLDSPALRVSALAVQQLLAMKLSAWRDDVDIEDARLLLTKLSDDREAVHNVAGRWVRTLFDWPVMDGSTTCDWDLRDALGRDVPNGLYFLQASGKRTPPQITRLLCLRSMSAGH